MASQADDDLDSKSVVTLTADQLDSASIHTTDFLSTTDHGEEMSGMVNTPKPKHQLKARPAEIQSDDELITDPEATPKSFRKSNISLSSKTETATLTPGSVRSEKSNAMPSKSENDHSTLIGGSSLAVSTTSINKSSMATDVEQSLADDTNTSVRRQRERRPTVDDAVSIAGTITEGADSELKHDTISMHSQSTLKASQMDLSEDVTSMKSHSTLEISKATDTKSVTGNSMTQMSSVADSRTDLTQTHQVTDSEATPKNERRTESDAVSMTQTVSDSISMSGRSEKQLTMSAADTISHNSSTLHAPNSEISEAYNVSSVAKTETDSLAGPNTPKSLRHDDTINDGTSTIDGQSIKNPDALSVSGLSIKSMKSVRSVDSRASRASGKSSATVKSHDSNKTTTSTGTKTISSVGATVDSVAETKMSKGLDTISVHTAATDTVHSSVALGAPDTASISGSQTGTITGSRLKADTMSYQGGLSRAGSLMSVNSSATKSQLGQNRSQYGGYSDTASMSSKHTTQTSHTTMSVKQSRIQSIYNSVYQGISDYISIFTAELNVLQTQLMHDATPDEAKDELANQLQSTEKILQKLQYQQSQATEIYEQYKIQEKHYENQEFKKGQSELSPVSINIFFKNRLSNYNFGPKNDQKTMTKERPKSK